MDRLSQQPSKGHGLFQQQSNAVQSSKSPNVFLWMSFSECFEALVRQRHSCKETWPVFYAGGERSECMGVSAVRAQWQAMTASFCSYTGARLMVPWFCPSKIEPMSGLNQFLNNFHPKALYVEPLSGLQCSNNRSQGEVKEDETIMVPGRKRTSAQSSHK